MSKHYSYYQQNQSSKDNLRAMNMRDQQLRGKEFDSALPFQNVKFEKVDFAVGWFSRYPDEQAIARVIQSYQKAGWKYVGRKEECSLFAQHTVLKFI